MSITGFWLIRHALVDENSRAMLYGVMDVPLCETTLIEQAPIYQALAGRLPRPAKWVVSPLSRTRRTAETIFAHGYPTAPLQVEQGVIEQSLGDWQGLPHAELPSKLEHGIHAFWPLRANENPPNGESLIEVITRIGHTLDRLAEHHAGEDIVIVSHGGAIRAALAHAIKSDPDVVLHFSIQNLSLTRLEHHPEGWRVVCVNEVAGY